MSLALKRVLTNPIPYIAPLIGWRYLLITRPTVPVALVMVSLCLVGAALPVLVWLIRRLWLCL